MSGAHQTAIYAPVAPRRIKDESVSTIERRVIIAAGLCVMGFALVGLRLVDVGILKGSTTGISSAVIDEAPPTRADLLDRNGVVLARDLPVGDLYALPHAFEHRGGAAR